MKALSYQKPVYQDFIISDASTTKPGQLFKHWFRLKIRRPAKAFYGTQVRRIGKSRIEVTFELPPKVRQQMQRAVESGKQIRLYVP